MVPAYRRASPGRIMQQQAETIGRAKARRPLEIPRVPETPQDSPTLAEAGIHKNLAHHARAARRVER